VDTHEIFLEVGLDIGKVDKGGTAWIGIQSGLEHWIFTDIYL